MLLWSKLVSYGMLGYSFDLPTALAAMCGSIGYSVQDWPKNSYGLPFCPQSTNYRSNLVYVLPGDSRVDKKLIELHPLTSMLKGNYDLYVEEVLKLCLSESKVRAYPIRGLVPGCLEFTGNDEYRVSMLESKDPIININNILKFDALRNGVYTNQINSYTSHPVFVQPVSRLAEVLLLLEEDDVQFFSVKSENYIHWLPMMFDQMGEWVVMPTVQFIFNLRQRWTQCVVPFNIMSEECWNTVFIVRASLLQGMDVQNELSSPTYLIRYLTNKWRHMKLNMFTEIYAMRRDVMITTWREGQKLTNLWWSKFIQGDLRVTYDREAAGVLITKAGRVTFVQPSGHLINMMMFAGIGLCDIRLVMDHFEKNIVEWTAGIVRSKFQGEYAKSMGLAVEAEGTGTNLLWHSIIDYVIGARCYVVMCSFYNIPYQRKIFDYTWQRLSTWVKFANKNKDFFGKTAFKNVDSYEVRN